MISIASLHITPRPKEKRTKAYSLRIIGCTLTVLHCAWELLLDWPPGSLVLSSTLSQIMLASADSPTLCRALLAGFCLATYTMGRTRRPLTLTSSVVLLPGPVLLEMIQRVPIFSVMQGLAVGMSCFSTHFFISMLDSIYVATPMQIL